MKSAGCYRVTVRGTVSARLVSAFEGMRLEAGSPGTTALVGEMRDQAELYGLLNRLRDLGVDLIRVEEVTP